MTVEVFHSTSTMLCKPSLELRLQEGFQREIIWIQINQT